MRILILTVGTCLGLTIAACSEDHKARKSQFSSSAKKAESQGDDSAASLGELIGSDGGEVSNTAGGSAAIDGLTNVRHCKFAVERGYLVTETKTISYQSNWDLGGQCTWDGMINGQIRGYKEWPEVFEIASDRVICDMKLTSGGELQYDDSIVLSLNDNVLAWGNLDISNVFDTVGNIYQYDLNKIIGASMQDESVGCVEGATECVMPSHDIPGNIKIAFSDELNEKIMLDVEAKGATFTLRAFGDNDPADDCEQKGVNLDITYSYFVK